MPTSALALSRRRSLTFTATVTVLMLLAAAVAAVASSTSGPATSFAFVARGDNPVDALAAAPVAGRLDAPVFLTPQDHLTDVARDGLAGADPDVVVLAGGTGALTPQVQDAVTAAVAGAEVRRIAGSDRFDTAAKLAALIREYEPAFVYDLADTDTVAVSCPDGEVLSGISATGEADCVIPPEGPKGDTGPTGATGPQGPQGEPGSDATNLFAHVRVDGTLASGSGVTDVTRNSEGNYTIWFDQDIDHCAWIATPGFRNGGVSTYHRIAQVGSLVGSDSGARVLTFDHNGNKYDYEFSLAVFC